ncbi:MAG: hypothetical protein DRQ88_01245 [Epsilonproteobacteria bacterium]|nr:MAG: hypothetical protein DRQ89_05315 [Campylobacterota bacterium]RLA67919.1 MAG: hypothetical protein DRQ88_01245 [Campylobacterota bacterium]
MKMIALIFSLLLTINAQAANWNRANSPANFDREYKTSFWFLPKEGKVKRRPWSGDYWPTYKGGITYRWADDSVSKDSQRYFYRINKLRSIGTRDSDIYQLSPAEKWDLYRGDTNWSLTNLERDRTKIYTKNDIPEWEGLCHGWAPATLLYKNPKPITVIGAKGHKIEFGSADIKALMTYHMHLNKKGSKTNFLGSRCNLDFKKIGNELRDGVISRSKYNNLIGSVKCGQDTNAGAFHTVLANEIGKRKTGFVMDATRDAEVWNHAIYSYKTKVLSKSKSISRGAARGTKKEVTVKTTIIYITEVSQRWRKNWTNNAFKKVTYKYVLELGSFGRIIGGRWLSFKRPDFIWKQTIPSYRGILSGLDKIIKKSR